MTQSELQHLELLAHVDDVVGRLMAWSQQPSSWVQEQQAQLLGRRLLSRCENLRVRMESPLVVATFGGTGTGKSSLVNALVGSDVTASGRQRPTTRQPILLVHPDLDIESSGLPLSDVQLVRNDAQILRDVVLLDCPDPDTNEAETPGSNLERLRHLLPWCDVLICTSTQQKYRSARVIDELTQAAAGCRLVFVQTHADLDTDIRDDWRNQMSPLYQVAEMFFVDSRRAFAEQQEGRKPTGEFGQLLDLLRDELSSGQRVRIRRANMLDLLEEGLALCLQSLQSRDLALAGLDQEIAQQQHKLTGRMSQALCDDLLQNLGLWERRLLSDIAGRWGLTPFGSVLKLFNSQASLIASYTLMRARTPAQMVLIGTIQGARWIGSQQEAARAEASLNQLAQLGFSEGDLRESEIIVQGHARQAGWEGTQSLSHQHQAWRNDLQQVEQAFLTDASRQVDAIIQNLAKQRSHWLVRWPYESVLTAYLVFVLGRIGKNFFYDSLLFNAQLLDSNFYIPAAIFLVLIAGGLLGWFLSRSRTGLNREIQDLARHLASTKLSASLFSNLQESVAALRRSVDQVRQMHGQVESMQRTVADGGARLSGAKPASSLSS